MNNTYVKINNNYYGINETIFVIENAELTSGIITNKNFWDDSPVISEIPETDYANRIEKDIDQEYETLT